MYSGVSKQNHTNGDETVNTRSQGILTQPMPTVSSTLAQMVKQSEPVPTTKEVYPPLKEWHLPNKPGMLTKILLRGFKYQDGTATTATYYHAELDRTITIYYPFHW